MASKRTIDLLTESYKEEMTTRRKYEWKNSNGDVIETLYFKPLTRYDRKKAQAAAGNRRGINNDYSCTLSNGRVGRWQ